MATVQQEPEQTTEQGGTPIATQRQERYCILRALGFGHSHSYRAAGYEVEKGTVAYQSARRLNKQAHIRARVAFLEAHPGPTKSESLRALGVQLRWPGNPETMKLQAIREAAAIEGWHHHKKDDGKVDTSADMEHSRQLAAAAQELVDEAAGGGRGASSDDIHGPP